MEHPVPNGGSMMRVWPTGPWLRDLRKEQHHHLEFSATQVVDDATAVAIAGALKTNATLQTLGLRHALLGPVGVEAVASMLDPGVCAAPLHKLALCNRLPPAEGGSLCALGGALRSNKTLQVLDLSGTVLDVQTVAALADALCTNVSLKSLSLGWCCLGEVGVKSLATALQSNRTLHLLDVSGNQGMGDSGVRTLAEALGGGNTTLQTLKLASISAGDAGASALAIMLESNNSLRELHLQANGIGDEGALALGKALRFNSGLQGLRLKSNFVSPFGMRAISDALLTNTCLRELELAQNRVGEMGASLLADALRTNTTLLELNLDDNVIGMGGLHALSDMLRTNTTLEGLHVRGHRALTLVTGGLAVVLRAFDDNRTLLRLSIYRCPLRMPHLLRLEDVLCRNRKLNQRAVAGVGQLGGTALAKQGQDGSS